MKQLIALEQELTAALSLLLDCIDYTKGNCRINEMVGAVVPKEVLAQAQIAKEKARSL